MIGGQVRARLLIATLVVLGLGVTEGALARPSRSASAPQRPSASALRRFSRLVRQALEQYRARRFDEARRQFDLAIAAAPAGADVTALAFNRAACAFQLGQYRQAEQEFASVAEQASLAGGAASDAALAWSAWGSAGLSALGAHDAAGARIYLDRLERGGDDARAERDRLASAIEAQQTRAAERALVSGLEGAALAIREGAPARAESLLEAIPEGALRASEPRARAQYHYLRGVAARQRAQRALSRAHYERAVAADPTFGTAQAALGQTYQDEQELRAAGEHYARALRAELSESETQAVRRALDGLRPLPEPGWSAFADLGFGFDSNASQSGSSEALGLGIARRVGSTQLAPSGSLEWQTRMRPRVAAGAYAQSEALFLLAPGASDLSLQTHEMGALSTWAPTLTRQLRAAVHSALSLSGPGSRPFFLEAGLSLAWSEWHRGGLRTEVSLEAGPSWGLGAQRDLGGLRSGLEVAERWQRGPLGLRLGTELMRNDLGVQEVNVAADTFVPCQQLDCQGATYTIPLGYDAAVATLESRWTKGELSLLASVSLEGRWYLGESFLRGPNLPEPLQTQSRKTRRDRRERLLLRAQYLLGEIGDDADYGLRLDYSSLWSHSNVAVDPAEARSRLDYDDRNFAQHTVELGMFVRY